MKDIEEWKQLSDNNGDIQKKNEATKQIPLDKAHKCLIGENCLLASGPEKAQQLNEESVNNCAKGSNNHPRDLDHAIKMLNNRWTPVPFDKNENKNKKIDDNDKNNVVTMTTPKERKKRYERRPKQSATDSKRVEIA